MNIQMPENVEYIIETLNTCGHEAYIVGGCVRDSILGRKPGDWDITTSARPEQVKNCFSKTIDTGLKHGTVTVVLNGENFEVTTFRIEGEYEDNRRPSSVEFTSSIEEDLSRRDFTSNAIAYHPQKGYVDPFDGRKDIDKKVIRAVGDAGQRYREDALRMLRAIRFSAQLNFEIDAAAFAAIKENAHLIQRISQERIRDELTKLLLSDNVFKFTLLWEAGLLTYILPEFEPCFTTTQKNPWHAYNVAEHTLHTVAGIEKSKVLRWTMLLHDIGKPVTKTTDEKGIDHFYGHPKKSVMMSEKILKRLRFDNDSIHRILRLVEHHDRQIEAAARPVRKAVAVVGEDLFPDLLKVKEADKRGQSPKKLEKSLADIRRIEEVYRDIKERGQCVNIKNLAVNGNDLIARGIKPGKEMGQLLEKLFKLVLDRPEMNTREALLAYIDGN